MCQAMMGGVFDPSLCPLLQNLSAEEQEERMRTDPMIAACVRTMSAGEAPNGKTAKRVSAYHALSRASCEDCQPAAAAR